MDYIEVTIGINPYSDEFAEIIISEIEDRGFDSYTYEEPSLKAYIPQNLFSKDSITSTLNNISSSEFSIAFDFSTIKEENWNATWESSFEPVVISSNIGKCTIKAPYHTLAHNSKYTINIDPEMSFGTGHHQTTSMMVQAIMEEKISGINILDMGCGTGVLSIISAKLGAKSPIDAIDIEERAVKSAQNNAKLNRQAKNISTICGDALSIQKNKYDLILANINRNILINDMDKYVLGLKKYGKIFMSGFYEEDIQILIEKAHSLSLKLIFAKTKENWAMLAFQLCDDKNN